MVARWRAQNDGENDMTQGQWANFSGKTTEWWRLFETAGPRGQQLLAL